MAISWSLTRRLQSAVLLKGPIGALLPAAVAGTWLALEGRLPGSVSLRRWVRLARVLGIGWGFLVIVGLAAPWYVWAAIQTNGSLLSTFFWHHHIERAIGGTDGLRARPWWFYAPRLAVDFLPWTPVLFGACYYFLRRRRWVADPEARFGLVWLAVMVFVLISGRVQAGGLSPSRVPGSSAGDRMCRGALGEISCWGQTDDVRHGSRCGGVRRGLAGLRRARLAPGRAIARTSTFRRGNSPASACAPARPFLCAEAHALAFHVGNPIDTFLEWENLDVWAGRRGPYYIVMPPECAAEWPRHVTSGQLEEVARNYDLPGAEHHEHRLVLVRTQPDSSPLALNLDR